MVVGQTVAAACEGTLADYVRVIVEGNVAKDAEAVERANFDEFVGYELGVAVE